MKTRKAKPLIHYTPIGLGIDVRGITAPVELSKCRRLVELTFSGSVRVCFTRSEVQFV